MQCGQGTFVSVLPAFIKRCKNHFHTLPCGVGVIIGNNGFIWIGQPVQKVQSELVEEQGEDAASEAQLRALSLEVQPC